MTQHLRRLAASINPLGWTVVAAAIVLWQVLIDKGVIDFDYMPPPTEIVTGFRELVQSGDMGRAVGHTLKAGLLSTAIGLSVGILLGTAVGLLGVVRTYTTGTIDVLRSIPVVALMPVALLVWGTSMKSEIIVASYAAIWATLLNTAAGVRSVNPVTIDVARTFRLSRIDRLRKITLPAAVPYIVVGARLGATSAFLVTIVAEMLVNPQGIGYGLVSSQQALRPNWMWAYAVVAGILGYLLNAALIRIGRWGRAGMGSSGG